MNYRITRICRCFIGVSFLVLIFMISLFSDDKKTIEFAKLSGFYDEEFYLEIKCLKETIYYTLDSSDPDENSLIYTEPILISDASLYENVYSMITDVSLEFKKELKELGLVPDNGYSLPASLIDKATVVRAVCIDGEGNSSEINTATYFVGYEDKNCYDDINIISIVTDLDNLFEFENGIYVTGKSFDDYFRIRGFK